MKTVCVPSEASASSGAAAAPLLVFGSPPVSAIFSAPQLARHGRGCAAGWQLPWPSASRETRYRDARQWSPERIGTDQTTSGDSQSADPEQSDRGPDTGR